MTRTVKDVVEELNGMHVKEIIQLFLEKGIKGYPQMSAACPIASYIKQETEVFTVEVTESAIHYYFDMTFEWNSGPKAFIRLFDRTSNGAYETPFMLPVGHVMYRMNRDY